MLLFLKEGDYSGGHAPNLQAAINVTMFATYITGDLLPEALEVFKADIVGSSNLSICSYS